MVGHERHVLSGEEQRRQQWKETECGRGGEKADEEEETCWGFALAKIYFGTRNDDDNKEEQ